MRFFACSLCVVMCALSACKTNAPGRDDGYDSLIRAKVGEAPVRIPNGTGTYALFHSRDTLSQDTVYKYVVQRISDKEIMMEGSFTPGGYVRWKGDEAIELFSIPRHIEAVPDSSMYLREILLTGP